tara:strand:- start:131 stop:484 length:354 start_codon:yes stop_codon:yes gene_type:complete
MTIGKEIKQFRKTNNLSQQQLANMLGVSTPSVSRWETGKENPTRYNMKRIKDLILKQAGSPEEEEEIIREIVLITFESGYMVAIDRDQALDEIISYQDSIEEIQVVEYKSKNNGEQQ